MAPGRPSLGEVVVKTTVTHTVTYFLIGLAAYWSFDYARRFAEPGARPLLRQADEPLVMAGPLFQPIWGLLFGLAFYPLRQPLFGARAGWLVLWLVLVVVGILGAFGPAPGSVEGWSTPRCRSASTWGRCRNSSCRRWPWPSCCGTG